MIFWVEPEWTQESSKSIKKETFRGGRRLSRTLYPNTFHLIFLLDVNCCSQLHLRLGSARSPPRAPVDCVCNNRCQIRASEWGRILSLLPIWAVVPKDPPTTTTTYTHTPSSWALHHICSYLSPFFHVLSENAEDLCSLFGKMACESGVLPHR